MININTTIITVACDKDKKKGFSIKKEFYKDNCAEKKLVELMDEIAPEFSLAPNDLKRFLKKDLFGDEDVSVQMNIKNEKNKKYYAKYGELLLYALLTYTDSNAKRFKLKHRNVEGMDTFGCDACHFKIKDEGIELWLGEAKFYTSLNDALAEVKRRYCVDNPFESERVFLKNSLLSTLTKKERSLVEGALEDEKNFKNTFKVVPIFILYEEKSLDFLDEKSVEMKIKETFLHINTKRIIHKNLEFKFFLLPVKNISKLRDAIRRSSKYARV